MRAHNIITMKNYNYKKISILFCLVLLLTSFLFSCNSDIQSSEDTTLSYIPEAANQFAVDKETEVETNEPTKAHRNWPSNFKLAATPEIVIGEKQFLTKINHIYNNIDQYVESTIIVEGMYGRYTSWDGTFTYPMVYRNGPAEHGDDQYGGFCLVNINESQYSLNDWIKVAGKPFMYEHTDTEGEIQHFLFLQVEKIEVLGVKDRKPEMVND